MPSLAYGTNCAAFDNGQVVYKLGPSGCHGNKVAITPLLRPFSASIYFSGQVHCNVAGKCVTLDLIIQTKHVLLKHFLAETSVPDEFWSYVLCVIAALASKKLVLADLGKSNLAVLPVGPPRLRVIDLGTWEVLPDHAKAKRPSKDSQLWSFISSSLEAEKVSALRYYW